MSWKSSLLGALLVAIAGLAVGAVIGGKTTTRVDTVTILRKVRTPTPPSTTTSATTTPTVTAPASSSKSVPATTSSPSSPAGQEQFLASYLESQGGAETLNHDAQNASLDTNPSQQELAGQTYQHAVAFDLNASGEGITASYQIPTPNFTHLASNAVGLNTTSNASTTFHLTVYKNDNSSPNSVVLYQETFHGPSAVHRMSFATQGATDVLFVWTHKSAEPEGQDIFILADPVLTGGA
jgi:hypothetical protein